MEKTTTDKDDEEGLTTKKEAMTKKDKRIYMITKSRGHRLKKIKIEKENFFLFVGNSS